MPLFNHLAKLIYFLPCAILSIVILDLVRNQSLVTQYLHWTVYVLVGTTAAIFTGNMQNLNITGNKIKNQNLLPKRPNIILMMSDDQDTELGSLQFMPKLNRYLRDEGNQTL